MAIAANIDEVIRAIFGVEQSRDQRSEWLVPCPLCGGSDPILRISHVERSRCIFFRCCRDHGHTEAEMVKAWAKSGVWPWPTRHDAPRRASVAGKNGNVIDFPERTASPAHRSPVEERGHEPLFDPIAASVGTLLHTEPPERRWIFRDWLPAGEPGVIAAPGGTGKGQFVIQMGVSVACGAPFLGMPVEESGGVVILSGEDDRDEMHRRFWRYLQRGRERGEITEREEELLTERLYLVPRVGVDNRMTSEVYGETVRTDIAPRLIAAMDGVPAPKLIILDPLSRFRGGDENRNDTATRFVEVIEELRNKTGAAVLMPHHVSKEGSRAGADRLTPESLRGASGLLDGVRWAVAMACLRRDAAAKYGVAPDEAGLYVRLDLVKSNYGPPWAGMWLERGSGGVLEPTTLQANASGPELAERQYRNVLQVARRIIARGGPMTATRLREKYAGKDNEFGANEHVVRQSLKQAVEDGHLVATGGHGQRGLLLSLPHRGGSDE